MPVATIKMLESLLIRNTVCVSLCFSSFLFSPLLLFVPCYLKYKPCIKVEKKKEKKTEIWISKDVYHVWTDTVQISVQTWQENKGKQDVSCTITDTTVRFSTHIVWVITVSFTHTQLTCPFSLITSGEAANES